MFVFTHSLKRFLAGFRIRTPMNGSVECSGKLAAFVLLKTFLGVEPFSILQCKGYTLIGLSAFIVVAPLVTADYLDVTASDSSLYGTFPMLWCIFCSVVFLTCSVTVVFSALQTVIFSSVGRGSFLILLEYFSVQTFDSRKIIFWLGCATSRPLYNM